MLPDLLTGIYRHYKGPLYQVIGYGHDSNDERRSTVIYIGIQFKPGLTGPRLCVRTAISDDPTVDAFFDFVHDDGSKCIGVDCFNQRKRIPRFTYLGPEITKEMW